jgi:putative two-component system response regulator
MPEMDGYDVIRALKSSEKTMHIPVIFLTGKIDPEHEVKGLNLGAVDYITKPFSRELLLKRIDLHILFERQRQDLLKHNLNLENEVDKKTKTVMELQNAILQSVAELVECRDNVTGGHIERTQLYLQLLINLLQERSIYAEEIQTWDVPLLIMSSQLHDVGKISIKDSILMKPGKLTIDEFSEMKNHTIYGVDIIRRIEKSTTDNEFLHYAEIFACSHHERWDGTGYPYGLSRCRVGLWRLSTSMTLLQTIARIRKHSATIWQSISWKRAWGLSLTLYCASCFLSITKHS